MLTITWTWKCDLCGAEKTEENEYEWWPQRPLDSFSAVPVDWSYIKGKLLCPTHNFAEAFAEMLKTFNPHDHSACFGNSPEPTGASHDHLDCLDYGEQPMDVPVEQIAPLLT